MVQPSEVIDFYHRKVYGSWRSSQYLSDISKLSLIGSWDENNSFDRQFVSKIIGREYSDWIFRFREILQFSDSPLVYKNGVWRIDGHKKTFEAVADTIFNDQLDLFLSNAAELIQSIKSQTPLGSNVSPALVIGVSGGLAMLASSEQLLKNCSRDRTDIQPILIAKEALFNLDLLKFSNLATILSALAEVSPDEFMSAIENMMGGEKNVLEQVFSQENYDGIGLNAVLEVLKGLEILCWEERYLIRASELIARFSKYDFFDYGGDAIRSLATIYLPWCPQTLARSEKRVSALKVLTKKYPHILWPVLLDLLPNKQLSSSGTSKPRFRGTSSLADSNVFDRDEYGIEVTEISKIIMEMSFGTPNKLCELIDTLGNFPRNTVDKFIDYLSSPEIDEFSIDEKREIWESLVSLSSKHRRFSDAGWVLPGELLDKIEKIAKKLTPHDLIYANRHYFNSIDFDLSPSSQSWSDQRDDASQKRLTAIGEIFNAGGLDLVLNFIESVKFPGLAGVSFAALTLGKFDDELLPKYCDSSRKNIELFIGGYIQERNRGAGLEWVDHFPFASWTSQQVSSFLTHIPATIDVWIRVQKLLGKEESLYWKAKGFVPEITDGNLNFAIDKFIDYDNPNAAIDCLMRLFYAKEFIDPERCIRVLNAASIVSESGSTLDKYHVVELIKYLHQHSGNLEFEEICSVEWAYLSLLDGYHGAEPIFLQKKLAEDPKYFHTMLSLIYKSKNFDSDLPDVTEEERERANKAWSLFHVWKIPPGMKDGVYSGERFQDWFDLALQMARESGRLEVALLSIGQVLIYVPPDHKGLWIDEIVASLLDAQDYQKMRNGFINGLFNKRGVHWVDPTGAPEIALAEEYEKKADDVENAGFTKLGAALRSLADSYGRDARL
jgi:hypothetical protein